MLLLRSIEWWHIWHLRELGVCSVGVVCGMHDGPGAFGLLPFHGFPEHLKMHILVGRVILGGAMICIEEAQTSKARASEGLPGYDAWSDHPFYDSYCDYLYDDSLPFPFLLFGAAHRDRPEVLRPSEGGGRILSSHCKPAPSATFCYSPGDHSAICRRRDGDHHQTAIYFLSLVVVPTAAPSS